MFGLWISSRSTRVEPLGKLARIGFHQGNAPVSREFDFPEVLAQFGRNPGESQRFVNLFLGSAGDTGFIRACCGPAAPSPAPP